MIKILVKSYVSSVTTIILLMSFPGVGSAGNWISSGTGKRPDHANPWFLPIDPVVNACIVIDEDRFGVTAAVARQVIDESIAFWQDQFRRGTKEPHHDPFENDKSLADIEFRFGRCSTHTDLRFQLGIVHPDQRTFIDNSTFEMGLAVRTEYSPKKLRGQGFIYLPPERGPDRPNNEKLMPHFWSAYENRHLLMTLIHELGHVYGLTHESGLEIMRTDFVRESEDIDLVDDSRVNEFWREFATKMMRRGVELVKQANHFRYDESLPVWGYWCVPYGDFFFARWQDFFKYEDGDTCTSYSFKDGKFEVTTKSEDKSSKRTVGTAFLSRSDYIQEERPVINLWVTAEQEVLNDLNEELPAYAPIMYRQEESYFSGTFIFSDGSEKQITATVTPLGGATFGGIDEGQHIPNLKGGTELSWPKFPGFNVR